MLVFVRVFGFIVFSFSLFRFPSLSAGSECLGGVLSLFTASFVLGVFIGSLFWVCHVAAILDLCSWLKTHQVAKVMSSHLGAGSSVV